MISPSDSIQTAIKVIDKEALRIALVIDDNSHLVGTVTDGDIRRALIKKISLDNPVNEIMSESPIVAEVGTPREQIMEILEKNKLLSIPILDGGKLVGLETLQDLIKPSSIYDNPVFIMAGGFGKRLRPLTDNCPKPLLKIGDKPILETIISNFIDAGFHQFYISTHYMPEMIHDHFGDGSAMGVAIHYIHEEVPLGTGGALGLLPKSLPDIPIIMMNGDILTKVDFTQLIKYHQEQNAVATMCVREYEYQVPYGVIEGDGKKITGMVEKPCYKYFVNAGIYVINRSILDEVLVGQVVDMPTLLESFIEKGEYISQFPLHEYWLDIGKMNDFEQAQKDFLVSFT